MPAAQRVRSVFRIVLDSRGRLCPATGTARGMPHRHAADGLHGSLMRISGGYVLVRFVGTAESGSSGQGCLGYLPRISARTAA